MQRRSLDALFSLGFCAAAALLVAVGYILSGHAAATERNVHHLLRAQRIAFPPKDTLTAAELGRPCVEANAGRWVLTAAQAQCYADDFLGLRIDSLVQKGTPETELFRADTQRGLLLATQMFDETGDRSRSLGNIFYGGAALMALLAVAGLMHRAWVVEDESVGEKRPRAPRSIKPHKPAAAA